MNPTNSKSAQQAGKAVLVKAKRNANSPFIKWLERFGFMVRGLIYFVIGLLALELAIGTGGATTSPTSAIEVIGHQPLGKLLLVLIAVGLAGYALWGVIRAILDPLGRGSDAKGLFDRAGFLFSGISYAVLLIPTVQALLNKPSGSAGSTNGVPKTLMTGPWGKYLVIAFGIFWIITGAGQLGAAYTAHFLRDLKTATMSAQEVKTATWLGKSGYAARGIVFVLIGLGILQTALAVGARQAQGFDGALAALAHAPYGGILLAAVAIGLILFGIYSAMCAKWTKIGTRRPA
jgi:Domain of Unknown Function (DUF1206)